MNRPNVARRVLYADNTCTFGGAIISLAYLVNGLDPSRYEPIVVSGQPSAYLQELFPDVESESVEVHLPWVDDSFHRAVGTVPGLRASVREQWAGRIRGAYWLLRHDLPGARRYFSLIRRREPMLFHANNNVESQFPELLAARLAGIPCVAHSRSFQRPSAAFRMHARLVDHHIAISTAIRDNLIEAGIPRSRVSVVFDGVDVSAIRTQAHQGMTGLALDNHLGEFRFGLFGRVVPWKGTMEFVRAAIEVIRAAPAPGARAFVVGDASDGSQDYFNEVAAVVEGSDVGDRIVMTGYREDVPSLMQSMDTVVHASTEAEPFGMVLIEAMAVGRPVVATRGGGPDDIVAEGVTGILVAPGSHEEIREAVLTLLEHPNRRLEMGAAGARRVEESFSSDRYASGVMKIYDALLDEAGSSGRNRGEETTGKSLR